MPGILPTEADVELLISTRLFDKFVGAGLIKPCDPPNPDGMSYVDVEQLEEHMTGTESAPPGLGYLSSGERRLARITCSFISPRVPCNLCEDLGGIDDSAHDLIITAVRHCRDGHGFPGWR